MEPSDELKDFVKAWEGCVLTPYADSAGYMTVGYGHKLPRGAPRDAITQDQADVYFEHDMSTTAVAVSMCIPSDTTQREFDAFCSFAFNLGVKALRDSGLLRKFSTGDFSGAAAEFVRWDHVGQPINGGILHRRDAERAIFVDGDYSGRP